MVGVSNKGTVEFGGEGTGLMFVGNEVGRARAFTVTLIVGAAEVLVLSSEWGYMLAAIGVTHTIEISKYAPLQTTDD